MEIRLLGTVELFAGGHRVSIGPRQRRLVLAVLAWEANVLVPVDRLVDLVWPDQPPRSAAHAIRVCVSGLRTLLAGIGDELTVETHGAGYLLRTDPLRVDVHRFTELVRQARRTEDDHTRVALLARALDLWRGPVLADIAADPTRQRLGAGIAETRLTALEDRLDALLRLGRHHEIVDELVGLIATHPTRERLVGQLMLALYRSGRSGPALAVFRRTKENLAQELGIDPGAELRRLELAILRADPELDPPTRATRSAPPAARRMADFVGRTTELAILHGTADPVADTAEPGLVLVAGEAGSGKSALLDRFAADLAGRGWLVCAGRCAPAEDAPPGWVWAEVLRQLAAVRDPGPLAQLLAPFLADTVVASRFRLHRAVGDWLARLGDTRVAILLDDLHRADVDTLNLLRAIVDRLDHGRLLLVAAYRPEETGPALVDTLGLLAAQVPVRLALAGLDLAPAQTLVDRVCGAPQEPAVLAELLHRTGGNPFYLKECARLLATVGAASMPDGVRDVLRRRFARLPDAVLAVLRLAAVVGREAEVDVLVRVTELDEETVLAGLEAGIAAGLLTEPTPGQVRFTQQLAQQALSAEVPALRQARLHARIATMVVRALDWPELDLIEN